jgi:hypothetical protein
LPGGTGGSLQAQTRGCNDFLRRTKGVRTLFGLETELETKRPGERNVRRCARVWSSGPRLGGGAALGDGRRARRSKSHCSAIGRWLIRRAGASSSTNRQPRPSGRRFAVAWPAASLTEARRGSAERRNNWDGNQRYEHPTGRERRSRTNDPLNKRACPPFSSALYFTPPGKYPGLAGKTGTSGAAARPLDRDSSEPLSYV